MILVAIIINAFAWIVTGYAFGRYFSRFAKCGSLCAQTAGVLGAIGGGFSSFLAYGYPNLLLWPNSFLFSMISSLGAIYISLPEVERARKVEQIIRSVRRLNQLYIDLAGIKR